LEAIEKIEVTPKLKLQGVICSVLDRLEKQYPVDFEKALHLAMIENSENQERKEELRKLLGASWDVEHTSLFLKLNHNSAETRLEAIRSVIQAIQQGKVFCSIIIDLQ
jgi:vesicle coat complex subunit